MRTFVDSMGRNWPMHIDFNAVRRVEADCPGVRLDSLTVGDEPLIGRLQRDLLLLVDVAWSIVRPATVKDGPLANIDAVEFARGLDGDGALKVFEAFWAELSDFFQRLRRTQVVAAIAKYGEVLRATEAMATTRISAIDTQKIVGEAFAKLSGSSQGLSE